MNSFDTRSAGRYMFCSSRSAVVLVLGFFIFAAFPLDYAAAKPREQRAKVQSAAKAATCKSLLLMEPYSGQVLFEENGHEPLAPASMVKMMVGYITMKKIEEGSIKLSDVLTTSAFASKIGGSQVYLKQGEQFTLEQLLEAVMIHSANDAAVAIAEYIGGSSEGFVEMMNAEAKDLGMNESEFHSPHGLPPGRDQQPDMISAYDMALLARTIIAKYPQILEHTVKPNADFRDGKFQMRNTNRLIHTYPGADGLKTGFYHGAGFCVTATAKRNNVRMLAVVMGCDNGKKRFSEASRLLSMGFSQYKVQRVMAKGSPAKSAVQIIEGALSQIVPVVAEDFSLAVKTTGKTELEQKEELCASLQAPVAAGTQCGHIAVLSGGTEAGRVNLVIPQDVPLAGWRDKVKKLLRLK